MTLPPSSPLPFAGEGAGRRVRACRKDVPRSNLMVSLSNHEVTRHRLASWFDRLTMRAMGRRTLRGLAQAAG